MQIQPPDVPEAAISEDTAQAAARTVGAFAFDAADAASLLTMLGLLHGDRIGAPALGAAHQPIRSIVPPGEQRGWRVWP